MGYPVGGVVSTRKVMLAAQGCEKLGDLGYGLSLKTTPQLFPPSMWQLKSPPLSVVP